MESYVTADSFSNELPVAKEAKSKSILALIAEKDLEIAQNDAILLETGMKTKILIRILNSVIPGGGVIGNEMDLIAL